MEMPTEHDFDSMSAQLECSLVNEFLHLRRKVEKDTSHMMKHLLNKEIHISLHFLNTNEREFPVYRNQSLAFRSVWKTIILLSAISQTRRFQADPGSE